MFTWWPGANCGEVNLAGQVTCTWSRRLGKTLASQAAVIPTNTFVGNPCPTIIYKA